MNPSSLIMIRFLVAIAISIPFSTSAQIWTLDSCVNYAHQHNLSVKISEQNIRLAEMNETVAMGNFLPSLNGQASHGYNWGQRIDQFTNQFATARIQSNNLGIASSINLFGGMRQVNTMKQASLNTNVSELNYQKMRNDIALNVATSYLNVLINKEFAEIARRTYDATERQVKRMEKLVAAGQMSQGNLNEILAQEATDNASVVSTSNSYQMSKLTMMQLLQLDLKKIDEFEVTVPALEDVENVIMISNPDVIVQAALNNFPEIKSAALNVASSDLGIKIANAGYSPSLNASFSYGTGYSGAAKVLTGNPDTMSLPIGTVLGSGEYVLSLPQLIYGTDDFKTKPFGNQLKDNVNRSLFFTLNVPLFNGFATRINSKRAEISFINAELQLEQAKLTLEQNVHSAYNDAKASLSNYYANKTSVSSNEKAFEWAELRYEQGLTNITDYADSRTRLENARATMTRSKYDFIFKLKILEFYQGKTISLK